MAEPDGGVFADARVVFERAESPAAIATLIGVTLQRDLAKERLVTLRRAALGSHGKRAKADGFPLGVIAAESLGHDLLPEAIERPLQTALQVQRRADVLPCRDFDSKGDAGFSLLCVRGGLVDDLDHVAIPSYEYANRTSYSYHNITQRSHPPTTVPSSVRELTNEHAHELFSIATTVIGALRTTSAGIYSDRFNTHMTKQRYLQSELTRDRHAFGAFRDGRLVGVALCHITEFPLNFSFLCGRVELLLHPDAPDRSNVVRDLCRASIHDNHLRDKPMCALLVDADDASAAVDAGYTDSGKQYSNFISQREGERGFASTAIALSHWYGIAERTMKQAKDIGGHIRPHVR